MNHGLTREDLVDQNKSWSLKRGRTPYPPAPVRVISFGNTHFADDRVKMRSLGWALIQQNKNVNAETETHPRRMFHQEKGRDGRCVYKPRNVQNC